MDCCFMNTPDLNRKMYKPSLIINYKMLIQKDRKLTLGSLRCNERTGTSEKHGVWPGFIYFGIWS